MGSMLSLFRCSCEIYHKRFGNRRERYFTTAATLWACG
ncbi:MAG: hypothetical protein AW11_01286 [Candidatus Accumulibacter regalis]|uniref:Uncharacterized protein n=1 Tax=Accumulibacter regalis TaxID=522306 RepID=A0A011PQU5_ACCRE|nr:MAG: hypothetical protein AW11_01286 [Candidatus Accumulibacter regalis]